MSTLSLLSLCNCWQIHWTSLLTNRTGRAGNRSLVDLRAKNQPSILDKFGSLFLVWLISFSLLPYRSAAAAAAVLKGVYSVWQAVGGVSGLKLHSLRTLCIKLEAEFCVLGAREKCHIQQNSEARGGTESTGTGHQSPSTVYCFAADVSESIITS